MVDVWVLSTEDNPSNACLSTSPKVNKSPTKDKIEALLDLSLWEFLQYLITGNTDKYNNRASTFYFQEYKKQFYNIWILCSNIFLQL